MTAILLSLFAKYPVPGFAKTRLIPALGAKGAANLHRHLAGRTCVLLLESGHNVTVHYTGADIAAFREWLGDKPDLAIQPEGDLTARLLAAQIDGPQIFFGADTPDLSAEILDEAISALAENRVVIGPAEDGGYYLIGMQKPLPSLFTDMAWSTDKVLQTTLDRLKQAGITPYILPTLSDCDRPEDLERWPQLKEFAAP
ncbi:TIGR04282 family arsenosugar biosynthesis glycosyltransferase [Parasphingorhabdus sp. DH2-15]|uniref:TIGR04282 family arsenosugar biosynthesis glycosyltransferase n=1 Tax=Parasphingorhabdus sp. DH2-15 TaxID=3444112 RepID=UPI003F6896FD